ncbi:MAG TPA: SDR family oxidoreductase [Steroidobacteraceae bacterium]|nr:SDR family oxidoreductase [Steroidobacteraceae bacterium]
MHVLQDQVAIITGASAGIGRATARLFAAEGAAVVLNARTEGPLQELAAQIRSEGGAASVVAGDVALPQVHEQLVHAALRDFGGLDIAVNNAGATGPSRQLADLSDTEWRHVLDVNLTAAFFGARSQIPAMLERRGGSIIFTSSFVGTSAGLAGMAAYGAAKAGLGGLVKGITADYAARGIRANAVLSGGVDTALAGDDAQKAWAAGLHALKRIARPAEIAQAMLFLAGPMSSFIAGSAMYVDGGNAAVK